MLTQESYVLKPQVVDLGEFQVPDPKFGDYNLNLHPAHIDMPTQFGLWVDTVNQMLDRVEAEGFKHYVTISSKFFTEDSSLRREGVHIDGNFCADPDFSCSTWGGTTTTWGGTSVDPQLNITTKWVSPYGITPPIGQYVSSELGGMLVASSFEGCDVYPHETSCHVGDEGSLSHIEWDSPFRLRANRLYFLSSDTPHSSLIIPQGTRRTLLRVTLDHQYYNAGVS